MTTTTTDRIKESVERLYDALLFEELKYNTFIEIYDLEDRLESILKDRIAKRIIKKSYL